jgi:hypothetical protein
MVTRGRHLEPPKRFERATNRRKSVSLASVKGSARHALTHGHGQALKTPHLPFAITYKQHNWHDPVSGKFPRSNRVCAFEWSPRSFTSSTPGFAFPVISSLKGVSRRLQSPHRTHTVRVDQYNPSALTMALVKLGHEDSIKDGERIVKVSMRNQCCPAPAAAVPGFNGLMPLPAAPRLCRSAGSAAWL